MKYRALTVVYDIDRSEMSKVVGGLSDVTWGEVVSDAVHAEGTGRARLQIGQQLEEEVGVTNLGQLLRYFSNLFGIPGNNISKFASDVRFPPGLK